LTFLLKVLKSVRQLTTVIKIVISWEEFNIYVYLCIYNEELATLMNVADFKIMNIVKTLLRNIHTHSLGY